MDASCARRARPSAWIVRWRSCATPPTRHGARWRSTRTPSRKHSPIHESLQIDNLVVWAVSLGRVMESRQQLEAVARQERYPGDFPLLQVLVGEQRRAQPIGVAIDFIVLSQLRFPGAFT